MSSFLTTWTYLSLFLLGFALYYLYYKPFYLVVCLDTLVEFINDIHIDPQRLHLLFRLPIFYINFFIKGFKKIQTTFDI